MTTTHHTTVIRHCDICRHPHQSARKVVAHYDAKMRTGAWANLCKHHFKTMTLHAELGTGIGLKFVYPDGVLRKHLAEGKALSDCPASLIVTPYRGYDLHQSLEGGWVDLFFLGDRVDGAANMDDAKALIDYWMVAP